MRDFWSGELVVIDCLYDSIGIYDIRVAAVTNQKVGIYGEKIDSSIIGEAAGLSMSILGCAISGKGIASDARKMGICLGTQAL